MVMPNVLAEAYPRWVNTCLPASLCAHLRMCLAAVVRGINEEYVWTNNVVIFLFGVFTFHKILLWNIDAALCEMICTCNIMAVRECILVRGMGVACNGVCVAMKEESYARPYKEKDGGGLGGVC